MKKTNTINLGSIIFHIEEDAFSQLQNYLNAIRSYFSTSEGQDEIITDIESRIAEIMQEKKISIITSSEVEDVIAIMGKPEEYGDESDEAGFTETRATPKKRMKIFRHPDDKILGGVCGGLGAYFNVDPVLFRLGFLLTMLIGGFGLLVYLILWVIAPLADRASDYLEMRGEPVTAETIGRTVASKIEETVSNEKNKTWVRKILAGLGAIFGFLVEAIQGIFIVLGKIIKPLIGVILLGLGLIAAIALSCFVAIATGIGFGGDFLEINYTLESIFNQIPVPQMFVLMGIILFVGIPLFQLIYLGLRLLFNMAKQSNAVKGTLLSLWIFGLLFMIFFGFQAITFYSESARKELDIALYKVSSDTLKLSLNPHEYFYWDERDTKIIETENGEHRLSSNVELNIRPSQDSLFHLNIEKRANAGSFYDARDFAENIDYHFIDDKNSLSFNQFFQFPIDDPYQYQEVELTLLIPVGKSIYLDEKLRYFIYDIRNIHRMHDRDMVGHIWKMLEEGLVCLNCEELDSYYETRDFLEKEKEREMDRDAQRDIKRLKIEFEMTEREKDRALKIVDEKRIRVEKERIEILKKLDKNQ
jgi:phage shock protein PspC (stress-responsive transcriptional regulator)